MSRLFARQCVVTLGRPQTPDEFALKTPTALRVDGLRVVFKIDRDLQPSPNQGEITIYNLSEASRAKLEDVGQRVVLEAGYEGSVAQIFSGDVRRAFSTKQGPDWVTKIEAGDGERAIAFARVSKSYGPGTPQADVMKDTIRALKTDPGNALEKVAQMVGEFASGFVQHAKASTELTRLLKQQGYSWSIQDGRVEVLGPNGDHLPEVVPVLTPETGLIGSPSIGIPTKKKQAATMKCRSVLLPTLRPGQRVSLKSAAISGLFLAVKVVHAGDTHGSDFHTDIEGVSQ